MKIKQTIYEPIDPGVYPAKITTIETVIGQFGEQLRFTFSLHPTNGKDQTLTGWCSPKFSPKAKLYGWVSAILFGGKEIPREYDVETETLVGQKCTLVVTQQVGDNGLFNRIDSVLPYKEQAVQPKPEPQPESSSEGIW